MPHKDSEAHRGYQKKYYEENQEKERARRKKYYEENKEKVRACSKKYREENIEKVRARSKKYYKENREKVRARKKKYREENIEKVKAREKKYREENIEKIKAREKKYREENQEKVRAKRKKYYEGSKQTQASVIYMIECKAANKYYIGQTSRWFEIRVTQHKTKFKSNRNRCGIGMQDDYNKYGPDTFEYSILKELDSQAPEKELLREERKYVIKFIKENKELYNKLT